MTLRRRSKVGIDRLLRVAARLDADPARVFDAWLVPAVARQWLFATASSPLATADIDACTGGAFRLVYASDELEYTGRYLDIARPRRIAFSLALPERDGVATRVVVEIGARKAGSTLTLVHAHVPADLAAYMKARWTGMFHGLRLLLGPARRRTKSFLDDDCRFHALPFDYTMNPPRYTTPRGALR